MKVKVQIVVEHDNDDAPIVEEVVCLCRDDLRPETLGLTLEEGKQLLTRVQEVMITHQTTEYVEQHRACPHGQTRRGNKGKHEIVYRSLFGKLNILSPRLYTCPCQPQEKRSFSPLAEILPERTAPEFCYLQSKWASLMSYGLTVDLLEEVLPLQANISSVIGNTHAVAERLEEELGEEQVMYIEGCEREWGCFCQPKTGTNDHRKARRFGNREKKVSAEKRDTLCKQPRREGRNRPKRSECQPQKLEEDIVRIKRAKAPIPKVDCAKKVSRSVVK